jgi:hypothetical protein
VTAHADFDIEGTGFCELWPKPLHLEQVLTRLEVLTRPTPAPEQPSDPAPWPRVSSLTPL